MIQDTVAIRDLVSQAEWSTRVELAAAYRLVAHFGMTELTGNHISCCVPGEPGHFLINPYGMLYEDVTASSLIKIDLEGQVVLSTGEYGVNRAGFVIHAAIHAARPDAFCVAHTHTAAGMAVSALKCGLLPVSQTSMRFLHAAYHDFDGLAENEAIGRKIVADLGDHDVMIMRNHGLLVCGWTIGDTFTLLWRLERACQTQLMAMACASPLVEPDPAICESVYQTLHRDLRRKKVTGSSDYQSPWPALLKKMVKLDPSFQD
ncbi:class II aldolase/adducin family protein [Caenimonas aquaedulcis]|uniref:class II aldolase/adducin family protein n=1 Tax=Caenimonas aquaedulcis TaxID=2793270 RepID=UPI00338E7CED